MSNEKIVSLLDELNVFAMEAHEALDHLQAGGHDPYVTRLLVRRVRGTLESHELVTKKLRDSLRQGELVFVSSTSGESHEPER